MTLTDSQGHFNLFPEAERKMGTTGKNPEREAEEKAKKEREDRLYRHTPLNDDRGTTKLGFCRF
jgi:ATP-dependent protease HslVU (ClpYQ) peptidase subunit